MILPIAHIQPRRTLACVIRKGIPVHTYMGIPLGNTGVDIVDSYEKTITPKELEKGLPHNLPPQSSENLEEILSQYLFAHHGEEDIAKVYDIIQVYDKSLSHLLLPYEFSLS